MPLATTKIWPVKGRLDHLINYVLNPSKTEQQFLATGINCAPPSAIAEMNATKRLFGKTGGTVAFHAYQSFIPGEATPEIAHEIGTRLDRELWDGSFQIVVTTHLVKGHIHNHIAINSVGFSSTSPTVLPPELIEVIEKVDFLNSIPLWAVTLLSDPFAIVLSFVMILSVHGRFFKIYMYTALAPVPLASFAGEPSQSIGKSFVKSYGAVCLEGAIIALVCIIFSLFAGSPRLSTHPRPS